MEDSKSGPLIKLVVQSVKPSKKVKDEDDSNRELEAERKRYIEMERKIKEAEVKALQNSQLRDNPSTLDPGINTNISQNNGEICI